MIVKMYSQNINVHKPKNYFEAWYADLWNRRIGKSTARMSLIDSVMDEELSQIGAKSVQDAEEDKFIVTFNNDENYTLFVLRWA